MGAGRKGTRGGGRQGGGAAGGRGSSDAAKLRHAILRCLHYHGPLSDRELAVWLNYGPADYGKVRKRRADLKAMGLVCNSRLVDRRGTPQTKWKLTEEGWLWI